MPTSPTLAIALSVHGHHIRLTERQWTHIVDSHDYMAGNRDKVLETLEEPEIVVEGDEGASLALRLYPATNITRKTMVVVYRDERDGFVITCFLTSRADKIVRGRRTLWRRD